MFFVLYLVVYILATIFSPILSSFQQQNKWTVKVVRKFIHTTGEEGKFTNTDNKGVLEILEA